MSDALVDKIRDALIANQEEAVRMIHNRSQAARIDELEEINDRLRHQVKALAFELSSKCRRLDELKAELEEMQRRIEPELPMGADRLDEDGERPSLLERLED